MNNQINLLLENYIIETEKIMEEQKEFFLGMVIGFNLDYPN